MRRDLVDLNLQYYIEEVEESARKLHGYPIPYIILAMKNKD